MTSDHTDDRQQIPTRNSVCDNDIEYVISSDHFLFLGRRWPAALLAFGNALAKHRFQPKRFGVGGRNMACLEPHLSLSPLVPSVAPKEHRGVGLWGNWTTCNKVKPG